MAASVKLMYQPQPTPEVIKAFKDTSIRAFSCGYNHVVALDMEKQAWSWGKNFLGKSLTGRVFGCLVWIINIKPSHWLFERHQI